MQFAYQFPELVERLVLVASGGFGREVAPALRAATLTGTALALGTVTRLTPAMGGQGCSTARRAQCPASPGQRWTRSRNR